MCLDPYCFVQRRIYGDYIASLLEQQISDPTDAHRLSFLQGTCVDMNEGACVSVRLDDDPSLVAETAVLPVSWQAHDADLVTIAPKSAGAAGALFVMPHAIVVLLAALAAMLDLSALLLVDRRLVPKVQDRLGCMLFSIAMIVGRLGSASVVAREGDRATLVFGCLLAVAGFALLLAAPGAPFAMAGFQLIGLGALNLVPVLFRRAGFQKVMPAGLAVVAITLVGYAGILVRLAVVGFLANLAGLPS